MIVAGPRTKGAELSWEVETPHAGRRQKNTTNNNGRTETTKTTEKQQEKKGLGWMDQNTNMIYQKHHISI